MLLVYMITILFKFGLNATYGINTGTLTRPQYRVVLREYKIVRSTGQVTGIAGAASSGNGYFEGEFLGLEATIKSTKHFPDEPGN